VRLEGFGQLKNPVASLGIEPAASKLAAYSLNQLCYHVPCTLIIYKFFPEVHYIAVSLYEYLVLTEIYMFKH
jgi:hypothetical protein